MDKDKITKIIAAFFICLFIILIISVISGLNAVEQGNKESADKMVQYDTMEEVLEKLNIDSVTLPDDLTFTAYYIEDEKIFVAESNGIYFKKSLVEISENVSYKTIEVQDDNDLDVTYEGTISNPLNIASYKIGDYYYEIFTDVGLEVRTMIEYTKVFR